LVVLGTLGQVHVMHAPKPPFAVRLIGFDQQDGAQLATALARSPAAGPAYFCLLDDSLQEPDVFIANGDDRKALARLDSARPCPVQPALVAGGDPADCHWPCLAKPLDGSRLHALLAQLMARREQALEQLAAPGRAVALDRRRHARIPDGQDADTFYSRRQPPPDGAVLIIDKGGAFRDHVAEVLDTRRAPVEWTDSAPTAVRLCDETPVSLVMINTATPGIDPYLLCSAIKAQGGAARTAVVFLVSRNFHYDSLRARDAGVRGLLDKPVADRHLLAALHKLLSLPA
jgi:CheY-like chemotaxis protein